MDAEDRRDECRTVLGLLEYSKDDEYNGRLPKVAIHFDTDNYYDGLASLSTAVRSYVRFLQWEESELGKEL